MKTIVLAVLLFTFATPLASLGHACGDPADAKQLKRDFSRRMACEIRRARGLAIECSNPSAVCAADLDALAAVLDGASADRSCYRELYRQSRRYFGRRLRELKRGIRPASRAAKLVEKVERRCEGQSLALQGACSAFSDPKEGALCMRALVESLAQKGIGQSVRPNIVLVLTDDQRWDTLDVMPRVQKLVFDRGLEFTNSFTSTSLCCPDRASIFTGLYAHNHGVTNNAGGPTFDHNRDTIQRQLQENAGYKTALLGKYFVGTGTALGGTPAPGWNEWHVFTDDGGYATYGLYYNYHLSTNGVIQKYAPLDASGEPARRYEYSTDLLRDRTVALIDRWRAEPFFIEYAPFAPHTPSVAADRHLGTFAGIAPYRPPSYEEADLSDKPTWVQAQHFYIAFGGNDVEAETDDRRIRMLESLLAVDEAVEQISDRLEAQGLTDNTLLLFTSDNGYAWLEHWLLLKNYPYEESIRVPLGIRYPLRHPAPAQVDDFVQPIDFYPTFAELAGIPGIPVNGRSLVPLLDGDDAGWPQEILIEHYEPIAGVVTSAGIRTHDWKLIRTDATEGVTLELYDMLADPFEVESVAGDPAHASLIADLEARLDLLKAE